MRRIVNWLFCIAIITSCTKPSVSDTPEAEESYPPSSILYLNPDRIYLPEIRNMKERQEDESYDHFVLCHFSDIHGSKVNLERLLEFCNHHYAYIDDILHTGDSVNNQFSDDFTYWKEAGATFILNTIGNHDTAFRDEKWDVRAHAGKDSYEKFFAPYVTFWEIEQPELAQEKGLCYYYKDYPKSGIRLIVLDCMLFDSNQRIWLEEVLSDAYKSDLSVICVSHFPAGKLDHSSENVFDSKSPVESTPSFLSEAASNSVDSFIDYGGSFICWLGGHIHIDSCARLLSHPRQVCINIAEALCSGAYGDQKRIIGTKSQDLFNILSVNRNTRELSLLRVGADMDILGRNRFKYTIQY